jgi:hypothetical protein
MSWLDAELHAGHAHLHELVFVVAGVGGGSVHSALVDGEEGELCCLACLLSSLASTEPLPTFKAYSLRCAATHGGGGCCSL